MRALLIDDSRTIRVIVSKLLKKNGVEVCEAQDGKVGLKLLETSGPFDLAIVDWHMPEIDGFEFIETVRKSSANDGMQILVLTIDSSLAAMSRALEAGANEYAVKPINEQLLQEKLETLNLKVTE